ncbi:HIT zinc finger [Colletotrichum orchidophilum]|uniref:Box C/D snoRNA protein 1 n=1 Tax=Colletotrichum orchidophilum TaxID=1209926 RepID=A0A1G4AU88_9PEZI|nr:HIT zinc finger [Colletotrichum orchidophilum]OHE92622.1 HIT zinc finger [Colletotrichum orchidophilum]
MADPLLTSLCAICHIEPPKYKCPRCTLQTCSLTCTKRHKSWSSCNGIRDATAYVPPSKLKTAAGVDHDFNFLSGIERAVQRSEKEIIEERHLLKPEDLRPVEVRSVQWKTGRDGRKKRVLVTEVLRGDNGPGGARQEALSSIPFKKRLGKFGILMKRAPVGMVRQRENGTNFSRASGRINWQVEWLLVPSVGTLAPSQYEEGGRVLGTTATKKILAKALDDVPLYKAFVAGQKSFNDEQARKTQQRQQPDNEDEAQDANANAGGPSRTKKRRKHHHKPGQSIATAQDTETGAWHPGRFCMQSSSPRGTWTPHTGVQPFTGITEEEEAQKSRYSFYVTGTTSAATAATGKTVVHAVDATTPLGEALRDTTVPEFPTIYVVEAAAALPVTLLQEPKPVRLIPKRKLEGNGKRGGGKAKKPRKNLEDGELPSDGDDSDEDLADADVDRFAAAVDQIIAEQSLGEEDDDTTTSSSGTDSESDEGISASLAAKLALLKKKLA